MKLQNMKTGTKLLMGFGVVAVSFALALGMGVRSGVSSGVMTQKIVTEDFERSRLINAIAEAAQENMQYVAELLIAEDPADIERIAIKLEANRQRNVETIKKMENLPASDDDKALFAEVKAKRQAFIEKRNVIQGLLKKASYGEARMQYGAILVPSVIEYKTALAKYSIYQQKLVERQGGEVLASSIQTRNVMLGGMILALMLAGVAAFAITRSITRPLHRAVVVANAVAAGDFDQKIEGGGQDEAGQLMRALEGMRVELKERRDHEQKILSENIRVRSALDKCSTNVMLADSAGGIVYMNESISATMMAAEADLRAQLPNFDAKKLVGANMDVFHKNPAHQRGMLSSLKSTYRTEIKVGPRTFSLIANPIMDEKGERLGTVVEWKDRTMEAAAEVEVAGIVSAAGAGDFTRRMDLAGKEGFFRQIGEGINKLMETSSVGLNEVVRVLGALAKGDLTEKITNQYEGTFGRLKDDSNATVAQLTEIIGQIREASESIGTACREIAAGNTDLSQRTEQQASSLQETASSMEELTSTVKQNAENARQANQLADSASSVAMTGGKAVSAVVGTMSSINESSRKIVDIISVIDGIAFQTNILALNAAVEAARAGEQGRGFAVVASEVRSLAQRSAAAAKEIKTLIGDSVDKVEEGTKLVDAAGQTMEEIVQAVKRVTDIMAEIAAASQEQSAGIEQVNQAITQMDQVTQQNAALVEEASAAAESMKDQAGVLQASVSVFVLDGMKQPATAKLPAARRQGQPPAAPQNIKPMVKARPHAHDRAKADGSAVAAVAKLKPVAKLEKRMPVKAKRVAGGGGDDEWAEF
jgi:methyl-accepting chemotaxis protein